MNSKTLAFLITLVLLTSDLHAVEVSQPAADAPVVAEVDLLVVGGSVRGVVAAEAAARAGAKTMLVTPLNYLGDEMTATLQLWLEEGESVSGDPLAAELYNDPQRKKTDTNSTSNLGNVPAPRPMYVKTVLEKLLIEQKVQFLYSCYATEVLLDKLGHPAGVVISNGNGRQVILAKTILDATREGHVAKIAGAPFTPFVPGKKTLKFVAVGGSKKEVGAGESVRTLPHPFPRSKIIVKGRTSSEASSFSLIEYTLERELPEETPEAWAKIEQTVRVKLFDPNWQVTSDQFAYVPTSRLVASSDNPWQSDALPTLWLFSPAAGVDDELAQKLTRPVHSIPLAKKLGKEIADAAKKISAPAAPLKLAQRAGAKKGSTVASVEVAENLDGLRPRQKLKRCPLPSSTIPVVAECDVLVIGGGTAGAPAGIAASRAGAKTIVIEYLHGLGGVGTQGMVSTYFYGKRIGFSMEVLGGKEKWSPQPRAHWFLAKLSVAGGEVWFGAMGTGVLVDKKKKHVHGAVVATAHGRGVILAKSVVDATGRAAMASAAGIPCQYIIPEEIAVQGTGLPPIRLGEAFNNTDWTYSHEGDLLDTWRMFVHAKSKFPDAFDLGKLIDTRERQRVVGETTITPIDQVCQRRYTDTISHASSIFDSHGYTLHPLFTLETPNKEPIECDIPYRALLPKDWDGLLVSGIGISTDRDALPIVRMQACVQNQGYAAGLAAAMAAKENTTVRNLNVKKLQKKLVEIGNLEKRVLTDNDNFPLSNEQLEEATKKFLRGERTLAYLLADRTRGLPRLQDAYEKAENDQDQKLRLAKVLLLLGDKRGMDDVIDALNSAKKWDPGWDFKGLGQFGATVSPLDQLVYVLGVSRDKKALPALHRMAKMLSRGSSFSHHRMIALALENINDPSSVEVLSEVLQRPGMIGYAQTSLKKMQKLHPDSHSASRKPRDYSLREIGYARALFNLGDKSGLGEKILREYARDLRGHFAQHAKAILQKAGKEVKADEPY